MSTRSSEQSQSGHAAVAWLAVVALLLPAVFAPAGLPAGSICLFRNLTGIPCPGCGLTHAFLAAGRGHWSESFAWHPLGPAAWLALAAYLSLLLGARLGRFPVPRVRGSFLLGALCLLLILWGLRLLTGIPPVEPWRDSVP